ncbi:MAG TPA: ABC transporter substrate-binding protein [Candidatus Acidoferrum sp.]|jgi:ABC-type nitrate/sulfonate/bicarbonate transport system substrate-binding protein|nr:ABC transporter substrate-binding protein [Candidatus Acidoferrum sp.]
MTVQTNPSRRTRFRGRLGAGALLATLLVSVSLLSACSSSSKPATAAASSPKLDTVVYQLGWKKLAQFGGHFAALKEGYFAQQGIDAKFLSGGPNIDPITMVANGQADIGDANGSDILLANSKGIPISTFATIYQQTPNALMSLESNPVTKLTDMVGKTIGLPAAEDPLLKAMLTQAGVDPSKVKMVPVGTDPSVLTSKQVDGYVGYGTEQGLSLQQSGAKVNIKYFSEIGDPDYGNALFAKSDAITAKADLLTRWLKADLAGWKYFTEHPEEIAQYTWDQYHNETGAVLADEKVSAKAAVPLITSGDAATHGLMWISQSAFQTVDELYKTAGMITKPVDFSKLVNQSILIAAGAKR